MSWIVESLLSEREKIYASGNIDGDDFNDLIAVEKALDDMRKDGLIRESDVDFLLNHGTSLVTDKNEKRTSRKKFAALCERIAFYLGGYFTDEGYISYMTKKYNLDQTSIERAKKYIRSSYKNMIMRNPINE